MKRGKELKLLCFLFLIVLCGSLISAGFLTNFARWFTGAATTTDCIDSDGGIDFTKFGWVDFGIRYEDYCAGDVAFDYYCQSDGTSLPPTAKVITGFAGEGDDPGTCPPDDPTCAPELPPKASKNCMDEGRPCLSGGVCGCVPNEETQPCVNNPSYESCKLGEKVCNDDGNGYGPCTGYVECEPGVEECVEIVPNQLECTPLSTCKDEDEDGYGNPASEQCKYSELDCNDNNPAINPGATETCSNNLDDDCDGKTDCLGEGDSDCDCGEGPCVPYICTSLGYECGTWDDGCDGTINCGSCETGENCNNEGVCEEGYDCIDNDGDGYGDGNGCLGADCDDDPNQCGANCNSGEEEICDGVDNNCQNGIDEGLYRICGSLDSIAQESDLVSDKVLALSSNFNTESNYVSLVWDPNDPSSWTYHDASSASICDKGKQYCDWGKYGSEGNESIGDGFGGPCTGQVTPLTETCDGVEDENCDGSVDEGCDCTPGEDSKTCGDGICEIGYQECGSDGTWEECIITETNEICECTPGEYGISCGSTLGICYLGLYQCSAQGQWYCSSPIIPGDQNEICANGDDDDCDGTTDEVSCDASSSSSSSSSNSGGSTSTTSTDQTQQGNQQKVIEEPKGFFNWIIHIILSIFRVGTVMLGGGLSGGTGGAITNIQAHCEDADGGSNYFVKGEGIGTTSKGDPFGFQDSCYEDSGDKSIDKKTCAGPTCFLKETSCNTDGTIRVENKVACKYGCSNGACLPEVQAKQNCIKFNSKTWEWENNC